MFISIYGNSLPSPCKVSLPIKDTRSGVLGKSNKDSSSSAGAPKLSGSITERHTDNSLLRSQFIHLWTHISLEFTQYVTRTASTSGEETLAILVSNYCVHLTTCLWSSCFLPLATLFIFCFFMKLVALVSQIYFGVYFYQYRFYFQTDSTALFHSMVLDSLEQFICLYSLFILLKLRLLFCDTVYCTSFPVSISDYHFSLS